MATGFFEAVGGRWGKENKVWYYYSETVSKEKPEQGKVIAVGLGRVTDEGKRIPSASKGDTVLFAKYAPDEVKIDGEEYFIISESSILAVIE